MPRSCSLDGSLGGGVSVAPGKGVHPSAAPADSSAARALRGPVRTTPRRARAGRAGLRRTKCRPGPAELTYALVSIAPWQRERPDVPTESRYVKTSPYRGALLRRLLAWLPCWPGAGLDGDHRLRFSGAPPALGQLVSASSPPGRARWRNRCVSAPGRGLPSPPTSGRTPGGIPQPPVAS